MTGTHSPKPWSVYILQCSDGSLYTGVTNDLDKRLSVHNAGKGAKYTKVRLPVTLRYSEAAQDRSSASQREYVIKQLPRPAKLALIKTAGVKTAGVKTV